MDEQLSLDTAEAAAPALRALATEMLQAEAAHLGVSLDAADVLVRRAEGVPALHVAAAADQRRRPEGLTRPQTTDASPRIAGRTKFRI